MSAKLTRKERNRQSARLSRERRFVEYNWLKAQVVLLDQEKKTLQQQWAQEKAALEQQLTSALHKLKCLEQSSDVKQEPECVVFDVSWVDHLINEHSETE